MTTTKIGGKNMPDIESFGLKSITDAELRFELEFLKYRLENILSTKKVKDISLDNTYKLKKLRHFLIKNDDLEKFISLISQSEIDKISKLKFREFEDYGKELYKKLLPEYIKKYKNK